MSVDPRLSDASKIISITPKFYIKDDGTDYDTGESFNGIWAGGSAAAPTGYGAIGHFKLNEEIGAIGFNNRVRGSSDLFLSGIVRSSDQVGTYVIFQLENNTPLSSPSPDYYIMMGTGGNYLQNVQFDNFIKTPGFENVLGDGAIGTASMKYAFDIWINALTPPQNNGDTQTLFYLHNEGGGQVMRYVIKNISGAIALVMSWSGLQGGGTSYDVISLAAGAALFPGGLSVNGGLHNVGFIVDREALDSGDIKFGLNGNGPEGFYVNGQYYPKSSGDTTNWFQSSAMFADVNALIGCQIDGNPTFTTDKFDGVPSFSNHFTGKIYQASLTPIASEGEVTENRMNTTYGLRFDIPRGPGLVDFSERFEFKGKSLLQSLNNIKQQIENDKGSFVVTLQSVKVVN